MTSERVFKVLVIGEPKVGKTAFVARYCSSEWLPNYKATVGADYAVKTIRWSNTENVRLHMWDIAGQDYARTMARTYYKKASGCLVMFDLTNRRTFEEAKCWKADVDRKVLLPNSEPIPCLLVANKCDLPNRVVTKLEVEKFRKDNGFIGCTYTSVKENKNLVEAISQLVEVMLEQEPPEMDNGDQFQMSDMAEETTPEQNKEKPIVLRKSGESSSVGGGCCYGVKS